MKQWLAFLVGVSTLLAVGLAGCGTQQSYPTKSVQFIVPFAAAGATDLVGRAAADAAQKYLGQPMVVVNKAGGSGAVGTADVAKAPPDGYTILCSAIGPVTTQPHLAEVPYKIPDDFTPIAELSEMPMILVVKADAPFDDVKGFIEYSKKNPDGLTFGQTAGSVLTLTLEDLRLKSGANLRYIPFDGSTPALNALLGGHIQAVPAQPGDVTSLLANKQVKVLGSSDTKSITVGDKTVRSFKEQGYDVSLTAWIGVMGPKGMSQDVTKKLEDVFRKVSTESDQYKETMNKLNQPIVFRTGAEFKTVWMDGYNRFADIIKNTSKK